MFLNILGRGGWDATEGVLAFVGEWLLQVYQLFLTLEAEGMRRGLLDPQCSVSGSLRDGIFTFFFLFLRQGFTM